MPIRNGSPALLTFPSRALLYTMLYYCLASVVIHLYRFFLIYVFLKIHVATYLSVLADHRCWTQIHLSTSLSRTHFSLPRLTLLRSTDTRRETGCECEYGTGSCALAGCHRVLAGCRPRNRFHSCGRNGSLIRVGRRRVPSPSPTLAPAPPRRPPGNRL